MSHDALEILKENFGDAVLGTGDFRGDATVVISPERLVEAALFLRDDPRLRFDMLVDLCGVDCLQLKTPHRYEVVYHLWSSSDNKRLRMKVRVDKSDPTVPSLIECWRGADWFERETFDLFGIVFKGHPNLKRLLTHEDFVGHALRKDYALNNEQRLNKSADLLENEN